MNRQFRTVSVLAGIFVFLVVIFILQEQNHSEDSSQPLVPSPASTVTFQRIFPELAVLDLAAIRLFDPATEQDFTMARDGGTGEWEVLSHDGTLNAEMATLIARTVVLLPYRRSIAIEEDADLAPYGFHPTGDFLIQFTTIDNQQHIVAIGAPVLDIPTFYGLVDDRPEVYLIERAAVDFLLENFVNPPLD